MSDIDALLSLEERFWQTPPPSYGRGVTAAAMVGTAVFVGGLAFVWAVSEITVRVGRALGFDRSGAGTGGGLREQPSSRGPRPGADPAGGTDRWTIGRR